MHRHSSMNRVYRLVWNEATGLWVAVAEMARGRGKSGTGRRRLAALLALNIGAVTLPPALAGPLDGIVIDRRTQTTLSPVGNNVDIRTQTIKGVNAFNSFSKFDVQAGVTANMHLPTGASNLINLVSGSRSQIDGVLNSMRNGAIGGNVWFVNPHGLMVGNSGVVNVGSLHVSTPTQQFVDHFFRAGLPDDASVAQLLGGTAPRNPNSLVSIQGRINAVNGVALSAGAIQVSGAIYSGSKFVGPQPAFHQIVNAQGMAAATSVVVQGGTIQIVADGEATVGGTLSAGKSGDITLTAANVAVSKGATVISNAEPGSGLSAGNVRLSARQEQGGMASIDVGNAVISGRNVTLEAVSTLNDASQQMSRGLQQAVAEARIRLDSADVRASDDLAIRTQSTVNTATYTGEALSLSVQRVSSRASVDVVGATKLVAGRDAALTASSNVTTDVKPAAAGQDRAGDASVAVSDVYSAAKVHVGDSVFQVERGLALRASNIVSVNVVADAAAAGDKAGGASVAVSKLRTDTTVLVDGATAIDAGALALHALSQNSVSVTAKAAAQGADKDQSGSSKASQYLADYQDNARTADSDAKAPAQSDASGIKVVGALAISDLESTTEASLASAQAASVDGAVSLLSQSANNAAVNADASSANGATGVATAVGINLGRAANTAELAQALGAHSLSVSAGLAPDAASSAFTTNAVSGAGASNVGLAGALGVNAVDMSTAARLAQGASFIGIDGSGAVSLQALGNTSSTVSAKPAESTTGDKVGIGASAAVNVVANRTAADIVAGASLKDAGNVGLDASGQYSTSTTAEAGAEGGIALTPASATAIVSNNTSARIGSDLEITGNLNVRAQQKSASTTTAKGSAVGGKAAIGAAVGVALVDDVVEATGAKNIRAGGAAAFDARGESASTVAVVASASGGHKAADAGSKEDANVDGKIAKQLDFAKKNQTANGIGDSEQKAATETAVADQKDGKASASTSEGKVSVAAAAGLNLQNSRTKASLADGVSVTTVGALTLDARNKVDGLLTADGSALPVAQGDGTVAGSTTKVGIGAAVAVNRVRSAAQALLGQNVTINAKSVALDAALTHTALAQTTSGAGASAVGLAGALALNLSDASSQAEMGGNGALNTTGGDVAVTAASTSDNSAKATPHAPVTGDKLGIGASAAVNVVANRTEADIGAGTTLAGAKNVTLDAKADHKTTTTAEAGVDGGVAITPAAAVAVVSNATSAHLGTTSAALSGNLEVVAQQKSVTTTTAKGSAVGGKAAIGAAVGVAVVDDLVQAMGGNVIDAGGAVKFDAQGASASTVNVVASATGGHRNADAGSKEDASVDDKVAKQLDFAKKNQTANDIGDGGQQASTDKAVADQKAGKASASTSEGKVAVAAAVGINLQNSQAKARLADGVQVTSGGALTLDATNNTDGLITAEGMAGGKGDDATKVGIGAAVAVNVVRSATEAVIGQNAMLNTKGMGLNAGMTDIQGDGSDLVHTTLAQATSGAGSSAVGLAGSLALNLVDTSSRAAVEGGTTKVDAKGGDVALTADNATDSSAKATPHAPVTGDKVGIGASAAINVVANRTEADIGAGTTLAGAKDVTLDAKADHKTTTTAEAGVDGGVAITPAAAVAVVSNTTSAHLGTTSAALSGNLEVAAQQKSVTTTTAKGSAVGGKAAIGAAVGVAVVDDVVQAMGGKTIDAGGAVAFDAQGASASTVNVVASATGGHRNADAGSKEDASVDDKVAKQLDFAKKNQTANDIGDGGQQASTDKAVADQKAGKASASTSEGKVAVAAAVGINLQNSQAKARLADGVQVTSGGALTLDATNNTDGLITAEGMAGGKGDDATKVGIGAAVAVNVVRSATEAVIGQNAMLNTKGMGLNAGMTDIQGDGSDLVHTTLAQATSGAGSSAVGLAGSLALNLVDTSSRAAVEGGTTKVDAKGGDVALTADNASDSSAKATPHAPVTGDKLGIGASAAINVVANRTNAELADGTTLTGAKNVNLDAKADHKTTTTAEAGVDGGVAITPAAAVAVVSNTTSAHLGTTSAALSGNLDVSAQQKSVTTTTAKGSAVGGKAAIGAAVGVALVDDVVQATGGNVIDAGGAVKFDAQGASASTVNVVASATGGHRNADAGSKEDASVDDKVAKQLDFAKKNQTANGIGDGEQHASTDKAVADQKAGKASASTSEGKVAVAAAAGINVQNSVAQARLDDGVKLSAGGALTLAASNNTDGLITAEGMAGGKGDDATKVGIGAAVAVNVVHSAADALVGRNASIRAKGLSLSAGMSDAAGDGSDLVHTTLAKATSGAGSSAVGLAGSLALNLVDTSSRVLVQDGASVDAGQGAVALSASGHTDATASATPHEASVAAGGKVGIGASVAVNVLGNRVQAELQDGAQLTAPGHVTLDAAATHKTTTTAEAGSAGGVAITPVVALGLVNNSTVARLGSGNALANAASVAVSAQQATATSTTAKGSAKGESAAIGAAAAVALVNDVTRATTDRDITAARGDVAFMAQSSSTTKTVSIASSKGGKADDQAGTTGADGKKVEDATLNEKIANQLTFGQQTQAKNNVGSAEQKSATDAAAADQPSAESNEGKVSVAAAASVNVVDVQTSATIGAGRTVAAAGALDIQARGNTDSEAKSDGSAVGKTAQVGIGAAVSVNKVDSHTLGAIGDNATISAKGVHLGAGMTDMADDQTHTLHAEAVSGAGASKVGIAASLALNLANTSSRAQIGSGATLNANGGNVSLGATDRADYVAKATPTLAGGASGGNVGVGVSAALNVIGADAVAHIGQNAQVLGARDLTLSATSESDSETLATAGAEGGKVAFDAAVATTTLNQNTTASIAAGNAISASGNVALQASSRGEHSATAKGEAKSGTVAVGASVGVITSRSTTQATLDRDLTAGGGLDIAAASKRSYVSDASASAGGSLAKEMYDLYKGQSQSAASTKALEGSQDAQTNQATQGGGKVAIAAAVGLAVIADKVDASVAGGHQLATGGAIDVSASQDSNFRARGAGDAVSAASKAGVGVGVGIAVSNSSTSAQLGDHTHITGAQDISVTAESTQNRDAAFANRLTAEGIAGAGGNKVGVAGAFAVAVSNAQTAATMGAHTQIDKAGDIRLQAHNTSMLGAKAWAGAVGGNVGVGASVATVVSNNEYRASIGSGSDISADSLALQAQNSQVAPGTFRLKVDGISDIKTIPDQLTKGALLGGANYYSEAAAGAAGDTAAVSGAFAVNVFSDRTETAIGANSSIDLGSRGALLLDSSNDTTSTSMAGAAAVGGKVGVGVSSAVARSSNDTSAHIEAGTVVENSGSIALTAHNRQDIDLISFSGGIGGNVGVSGTANVLVSNNQAQAYVADGAGTRLASQGNLALDASNTLDVLNVASGLAVGGTAGVGVAAAINTIENFTRAAIGDDVRTQARGATILTAAASEDLANFAVGAAGAGSAAVGGAALVNVMNNQTTARIGERARVNHGDLLGNQSVSLSASDSTTLFDVVGGGGGGGSVGVGASSDVSVLSKQTQASIGAAAQVDAARNVSLQASSHEDLRVTSIGLGVGGSAGLAGSAAAMSLTTDTRARVDDDAEVRAKGNVLVAATGDSSLDLITGSAAGSGSAAVGAAAGVVVFDKTTQAAIGSHAAVTALGQGAGLNAATGAFHVAYGNAISGDGRVADAQFVATDANGAAVTDRSVFAALTKERAADALQSQVNGLAVTATNQDSIKSTTVSGAGSGAAAITLGANVATVSTDTQATIGNDTQINQDTGFAAGNGAAAAAQSVRVAAGNEQFHVGIAGAASVAGAAAVGAGTDVFVGHNAVLAQVGGNAQLQAARNVDVLARGHEELLGIGAGLAASGSVGVAGSVAVVSLNNSTQARIAGGTTAVNAGGNVQVHASDDTSRDMVTGAAGIGLGVAGVGASVGVTSITKDTQAAIGNGATVNALGGAGTAAGAKGLLVQATSSEDLFTVAASGAGGLFAGVAGAVAVDVVQSTTKASIGDNARINTGSGAADALQDVNVTARNVLHSKAIVGSLAGGIAGLAGAVDVGIARNSTGASIGAGARINAKRDVQVNALGEQTYESTVVSAAGGLVGVAGGVSVYGIGEQLGADAQKEISKDNSTAGQQADREASDDSVGKMLAASSDARMRGVAAQAQAQRSSIKVSNSFTATQTAGNSARVGEGAVINAGRHLDVNARGMLDFSAKAGAQAVGAVSLGAGVALANIQQNNQATLGQNVVANLGGDLRLNAATLGKAGALGFAGTGGIKAVNGAYAGITDTSHTHATAGHGLVVRNAGEVLVQAQDQRSIKASSAGASVGEVAGGASVAQAEAGGSTVASIADGAQIGVQSGDVVRALSVLANSSIETEAQATALAGGIGLAASGAVATAKAKPTVEAVIHGGVVNTVNDVTVRGTASTAASADAKGLNLAGVAVGLSKAVAEGIGRINASLGSQTQLAARNLSVDARQTSSKMAAHASGASGGLLGVNATHATASQDARVTSRVGNGSTLALRGTALVNALNTTQQTAEASGISAGIVAAGFNQAAATSHSETEATLGDGVKLSGASGNAQASSLTVTADGTDTNRANAVAGSGGVVSGVAASATTRSTGSTTARTGSGDAARTLAVDTLKVQATHVTDFNAKVDSTNASIVGASGANALNTVDHSVHAGVDGQVRARQVDIDAVNTSRKAWIGSSNGDAAGWNISSGSGGLLDLPAATSQTTVAQSATAAIGAGANVHLLGSNSKFNLDALNTIVLQDKVKLDSGGAIAKASANSRLTVKSDATAAFGDNASVVSDLGDISAGARSDVALDARSSVNVYGAAGAPSGQAHANYSGQNSALVGGNARIEASDGSVLLAAGQTTDGKRTHIDADASVNLYNKTAFPISSNPDAQANVVNNANVQLAAGSQVLTAQDIALYAEKGTVETSAKGIGKDLYREAAATVANAIGGLFGGGDVSFDVKGGSTSSTGVAQVEVNGTAQTGIQRKAWLTLDYEWIDEQGNVVDKPVIKDGQVLWRTKFDKSSNVAQPTVQRDKLVSAGIQERIDYLRGLISAYIGNDAAVAAYQAQVHFLQFKLVELGLASGTFDKDGKPLTFEPYGYGNQKDPAFAQVADYVNVGDIRVKLGNIDVRGDELRGSGKLNAPGDARIVITNNTPDFLVLNKLEVASNEGGVLRYNNAVVNSAAAINRMNLSGSGAAGLDVVTRDTQGASGAPVIQVQSTYKTGDSRNDVQAPAPDIHLKGDITNLRGAITVASSSGSIYTDGSVNGGSVDIRADKGDFVQSYTDNFFHVGGDAGELQDRGAAAGPGIVANGGVFLSARYLNINSLVQSGIANWTIDLPAQPLLTGAPALFGLSQAQIDAAQQQYDLFPQVFPSVIGLRSSNGSYVNYNAKTRRIEATTSWADADMKTSDWAKRTAAQSGTYRLVGDYGNIGASYDPSQGRFVLDNTEVRGGNIQLYGQIMNTSDTGGGVLRALDGYGQISVNNASGRAVVINDLDTGADASGTGRGIAGVIDITDIRSVNGTKVVTQRTVYRRENGKITTSVDGGAQVVTGADRSTTYTPQRGLRYGWTTGTSNQTVREIEYQYSDWLRGLIHTSEPTYDIRKVLRTTRPVNDPLDKGGYLITDSRIGNHHLSSSKTEITSAPVWVKIDEWSKCVAWTLCIKKEYHSIYKETTGSKTTTDQSLKADYGIKIEFSGQDTGKVDITSNGNVLLNGAIRNKAGSTAIDAGYSANIGKSILQVSDKALTTGKDVTLKALNGIGDLDRAIALEVKGGVLNASSHGNVVLAQTQGDLRVGAINAGAGRVSLVSDGSITGGTVSGNRIDLVSKRGSIGSEAAPLNVRVGYTDNLASRAHYGLNAQAAGDISLQALGNNNLLVGHVVSTGGDVLLKASGAILDNNPDEQTDTRTWDALKSWWDQAGLRAGTAANQANQDATVRAFEQGKTQDYRAYWETRLRQADGGAAYDAGFRYVASAQESEALRQAGVDVGQFEAERTAQYHGLHASMGGLTGQYDKGYTYVATDADKYGSNGANGLLTKSSWTERELALSISDGLLKEVTNTNPVIKSANVQGRNVTLVSGRAIGETQKDIVIPANADPSCAAGAACLTDAMKVALASAERGDLVITDKSITVKSRKPLNFAASESLNVSVAAPPLANTDNGNAFVASLGDARLGNIQVAGDTRIKVRGSIVNAAGNSPAVQTGRLVLEAANGGIGYMPPSPSAGSGVSAPLRINLHNGASLTARAAERIDIVEEEGDLLLDTVYSQADMQLTTKAGSIRDAIEDQELNLLGRSVTLQATGGSIGTADSALHVGTAANGRIAAQATQGIHLNGLQGYAFEIGNVRSGGDVRLTSDHDLGIHGAVAAPGMIVLGAARDVSFAGSSAVTSAQRDAWVFADNLRMADGAQLRAANGAVVVHARGDASVTGISAGFNGANAVVITAGGALRSGGDTRVDIVADGGSEAGVVLDVRGSIGEDRALEIAAPHVQATAGGSMQMHFTGPVSVDHVQAGGKIDITADGAITWPAQAEGVGLDRAALEAGAMALTLASDSSNDTEDNIEDSMDDVNPSPQPATAAIDIAPPARVTYADLPVALQTKEGQWLP